VSDRAHAQGQVRTLNWGDRVRIAPTRIGVMADYHLAWGRGSVLNRISRERADASAALAKAARDARAAFGDEAQDGSTPPSRVMNSRRLTRSPRRRAVGTAPGS
jgi:putative ATP-dependent endonuclease of the OLD family